MATGMNFVASAANTKVVTFIQPVDMNADGEQAFGETGHLGKFRFQGLIRGTTPEVISQQGGSLSVEGTGNTINATYIGAETAGTFECKSITCFGDANSKIYIGGGKVDVYTPGAYTQDMFSTTSVPYVSQFRTIAAVSMSGDLDVAEDLTISQLGLPGSIFTFLTGTIDIRNGKTLTVDGQNSDDSEVHFNGPVTGVTANGIVAQDVYLEINNASNTFNGGMTAKQDALISIGNALAVGDSSDTITVEDGGTVQVALGAAGVIASPLSIKGIGVGGKGALINASNNIDATFSGNIALTGDSLIGDSGSCASDHTTSFTGVISGPFALTTYASDNPCRVILNSASPNTFTGLLTHKSGFLVLGKNLAAPSDVVLDPDHTTTETAVITDTGIVNAIGGNASAINIANNNEYFNFLASQSISQKLVLVN